MVRKFLTGLGIGAALLSFGAGSAKAETKLAVGTAAAKQSPWGQVFKTWKTAVEEKTKGAVSFEFHFNSTKGTEATMIDKMKAGELDGAAVTSVGLGKLDKRLLTIQVPGIMRSWNTVDAVRKEVGADFEKYLTDKKVTLVTWGDIGYAHFLSNGFQVKMPEDLKGRNPWVYAEDPVLKAVYSKIPGVNPFPAELMSVLPNISNGKIDCMSVSALAAEMLQWNSKFDNGIEDVNGIVVGAVILATPSLDKLPADAKAAVVDTGKAMGSAKSGLKQKIRDEDKAAWGRFTSRSGVKIFTMGDAEKKAWGAKFKEARDSLKGSVFDAALVTKIEQIAAANP
jgi:TRAP-type transport system periplasmic protein